MHFEMAKNFEDSKRIESNKPMESLQEYVELCKAQARAIENYARIVNKLKDDIDSIVKVKVRAALAAFQTGQAVDVVAAIEILKSIKGI
jgi:hypothetical protein